MSCVWESALFLLLLLLLFFSGPNSGTVFNIGVFFLRDLATTGIYGIFWTGTGLHGKLFTRKLAPPRECAGFLSSDMAFRCGDGYNVVMFSFCVLTVFLIFFNELNDFYVLGSCCK